MIDYKIGEIPSELLEMAIAMIDYKTSDRPSELS
jgi:hypothetical protein